jgi:hypothetical protein
MVADYDNRMTFDETLSKERDFLLMSAKMGRKHKTCW